MRGGVQLRGGVHKRGGIYEELDFIWEEESIYTTLYDNGVLQSRLFRMNFLQLLAMNSKLT
jgi:hypothetical protein